MQNKKLLVLSDTHGHVRNLKIVFNWARERLPPNDTILCTAFLGDGLSDLMRAANETGFYSEWKLIKGNNDYDLSKPDSAVFDFAGTRFFMCHGHRYSLYSGSYNVLLNAARSNNANVVLFGHTHIPFQKTINGILLVNPGSVGNPRSRHGASFAVIECSDGEQPAVFFGGINSQGKVLGINIIQGISKNFSL